MDSIHTHTQARIHPRTHIKSILYELRIFDEWEHQIGCSLDDEIMSQAYDTHTHTTDDNSSARNFNCRMVLILYRRE